MKRSIVLLALVAGLLSLSTAPGQTAAAKRARDILPAENLVGSSVVAIRDQAGLNAHYYLADETVLELGRKTDAILARYRTGGREALLLAAAYPADTDAGRVYGRFGRDFFSKRFDPRSPRFLEKLETGDWAGAGRIGRFLIIILEAPDRGRCDELLRRAEEKALALS